MKKILFGVVLGIFVASLAHTQQAPEQISIGDVPLQLGMAKDTAIMKLAEQGYKTQSGVSDLGGGPDTWAIIYPKNSERGLASTLLGDLAFRNERLSWVNKDWATSLDSGSTEIGVKLYFLVKLLEESGNTSCIVQSKLREAPQYDDRQTLIRCGRRTVSIEVLKTQLPQGPVEQTSLKETIQ